MLTVVEPDTHKGVVVAAVAAIVVGKTLTVTAAVLEQPVAELFELQLTMFAPAVLDLR
jgi:hypothetical protein